MNSYNSIMIRLFKLQLQYMPGYVYMTVSDVALIAAAFIDMLMFVESAVRGRETLLQRPPTTTCLVIITCPRAGCLTVQAQAR